MSGPFKLHEFKFSAPKNSVVGGSMSPVAILVLRIYRSLDFDSYKKQLAEIIRYSTPRIAIGVFGGCGTGKTDIYVSNISAPKK